MSEPLILIVDEQDKPIGAAKKLKAQKEGLIHRISHVMVEDPDGRILLQKRSKDSKLFPNCWDPAVGGHVDEGETYEQAAKREMKEEIGLKKAKLINLGSYRKNEMFDWRQLNRFYRAYKTIVPADTKFKPDPKEVAELRWFTLEEVKKLISEKPEKVAGGLVETISRFYL